MRRKGSIAQLIRKPRPGYIMSEDGCLVAFDLASSPLGIGWSTKSWTAWKKDEHPESNL